MKLYIICLALLCILYTAVFQMGGRMGLLMCSMNVTHTSHAVRGLWQVELGAFEHLLAARQPALQAHLQVRLAGWVRGGFMMPLPGCVVRRCSSVFNLTACSWGCVPLFQPQLSSMSCLA